MNPSLLSPESLEAEALTCAQRGDYGTAAALYEQSIALNPGGRSAYWQLGLMRLLQGEEAEAQLTWMMILSEVESDPQQLALAQAELWQAMQTAAAEQTAIENLEQAWLIRHHLREINPSDLSNLLEIIQLSIQLKRFNPTDLEDLGICQILQTRPAVDSGLLSLVIQQVLTAAVESPQVLTWLETCLPYYTQNSEKLIGVVCKHWKSFLFFSRTRSLLFST
jgi:tetratricopeptide (TPR) repeat protein